MVFTFLRLIQINKFMEIMIIFNNFEIKYVLRNYYQFKVLEMNFPLISLKMIKSLLLKSLDN